MLTILLAQLTLAQDRCSDILRDGIFDTSTNSGRFYTSSHTKRIVCQYRSRIASKTESWAFDSEGTFGAISGALAGDGSDSVSSSELEQFCKMHESKLVEDQSWSFRTMLPVR